MIIINIESTSGQINSPFFFKVHCTHKTRARGLSYEFNLLQKHATSEICQIKVDIADTKAKLKQAEEANDFARRDRLEDLLIEQLKKKTSFQH